MAAGRCYVKERERAGLPHTAKLMREGGSYGQLIRDDGEDPEEKSICIIAVSFRRDIVV